MRAIQKLEIKNLLQEDLRELRRMSVVYDAPTFQVYKRI